MKCLHCVGPTEPRFGITMATHVKKANAAHKDEMKITQDVLLLLLVGMDHSNKTTINKAPSNGVKLSL